MRFTAGRLITALVFLAIAAAAVWALMPRPISVETATVTRGKFVATVDEDGKTRVRERYVVAAPLSGRLSRVRLKVGDQVGVEDVVAIIAPSPAPFLDPRTRREAEERLGTAEATIERTKAAVERAKAQAEQANNDLARARTLVERGATTVQALERAELAMRVADRDLRAADFANHAAEHELSQAKALLAQYGDSSHTAPETWNVTAPVAGLVLKVDQESETIVQAGGPILELGDPLDLEIVVDVLTTDAVAIQPNAEVVIDNWGGQGTLEGRVRRTEPAAFTKISTLGVEEQRVNVLVDVTSPRERWCRLGDAYQVDTSITVFAQDDAIVVPAGALFRKGDNWMSFVVVNGRAEARSVSLLQRSGQWAAIASGLTFGERVIVYPSDRIASGTRVVPR